jgi:hypothetical protein
MRSLLLVLTLCGCGVSVLPNAIPILNGLCASNGGVTRYYFHSADKDSKYANVYCKNGAQFNYIDLN